MACKQVGVACKQVEVACKQVESCRRVRGCRREEPPAEAAAEVSCIQGGGCSWGWAPLPADEVQTASGSLWLGIHSYQL